MSREIKFRGKRIDNGEWVYGFYMKQYHSAKYGKRIDAIFYSDEYHTHRIPIIPETVGQCTGLLDKNKIEIYEGDVVKNYYWNHPRIENVVFNDKGYWEPFIDWESGTNNPWNDYENLEVIDNVYENPELLKEIQ